MCNNSATEVWNSISHLMVSNYLPNQIQNGFKSSYQNMLRNSIETLKKSLLDMQWIYMKALFEADFKNCLMWCKRAKKTHWFREKTKTKGSLLFVVGLWLYMAGVINKAKHTRIHSLSLKGATMRGGFSTTPVNISNLSFLLFPFIPQELRASLGSNFPNTALFHASKWSKNSWVFFCSH